MAFPVTELGIIFELYYSSAWNDITDYVYVRDGVTITRGSTAESSTLSPGSCKLTLNNRGGRFSPRNPVSPLYGLIGRNTPLRVRVSEGAVSSTRFVGEVSEWPSRWDVSGADKYVPIEASGIMRRLTQGTDVERSPMRREIDLRTDILAYWSCEEGSDATTLASNVDGGTPLKVTGTPSFGNYSEFVGSAPILTMNDAKLHAIITGATSGSGQARWIMQVPDTGLAANTVIMTIFTDGTLKKTELIASAAGGLWLKAYGSLETGVDLSGEIAFAINGDNARYGVSLTQDGADVDWTIDMYIQNDATVWSYGGTLSSATMGKITAVIFGPNRTLGDTAIGHIAVDETVSPAVSISTAINACNGETPITRITRLCSENDISFASSGSGAGTEPLGFQTVDTTMNLITEAVQNEGMLSESRTSTALEFIKPESLYNAASVLTLDYDTRGHIMPDLELTEDDKDTRNDVTVTRKGGSESRYIQSTGPLGTAMIGVYSSETQLSLYRDEQADWCASWRAHLGTIDAPRWQAVRVAVEAIPALMADIAAVNIGSVITLTDLPVDVSQDDERILITGYEETLLPYEWTFVFSGTPAEAYDVFILETDLIDSEASSLSSGVTSTGTTLVVATTAGYPAWTSSAAPFDIIIGGEVMRVTGIVGSSSPQAFAVTRSINGVVKSHSSGAQVRLYDKAVIGPGYVITP